MIILVFIFCQWHLIAKTMPTLTVINHFDVIKNISLGLSVFRRSFSFIRARFSNWKKPSATALSWQLLRRLMRLSWSCEFKNDLHSWLVYWQPWAEWISTCLWELRSHTPRHQCVHGNVLCHPGLYWAADNFVWGQINNHRKDTQPAFVGPDVGYVGYVRYLTLIRSIWMNCQWARWATWHRPRLACLRAPVSGLSLYPDTFHQSPSYIIGADITDRRIS